MSSKSEAAGIAYEKAEGQAREALCYFIGIFLSCKAVAKASGVHCKAIAQEGQSISKKSL